MPEYFAEDDCWYDAKGLQWTQIGPAPTLDPNYVYDTGPHFVEFSGGAVAWVTEHGIYGNDEAVRQFGIKENPVSYRRDIETEANMTIGVHPVATREEDMIDFR